MIDSTALGVVLDWLRHSSVRASVARVLGGSADVDDVLQGVAERVIASPSRIREPERYARRAARNAAIDHLRAANNRARFEAECDWTSESTVDGVEAILAAGQIDAVLDALPALTAEMFQLHYLDGLTQREIAERFGLHLSSVEKRLAVAKRACLTAVDDMRST